MVGDGGAAPGAGDGRPLLNVGLSGKLVVLTALFVMIAQVLVYVPSIANYRISWLRDIHATAGVAALALASTERLPDALEERLLTSTGAIAIALKDGRRRLMLTRDAVPRPVDAHADLDHITATGAVLDAFDSLLFGTGRIIPDLGILAAASPALVPEPLLSAGIIWNENVHAFRAAAGGSGQSGAATAVAVGLFNTMRTQQPMPVMVPEPGRANIIACGRYLPNESASCGWATDPRGSGLAASGG
jgi:hypothetical protein